MASHWGAANFFSVNRLGPVVSVSDPFLRCLGPVIKRLGPAFFTGPRHLKTGPRHLKRVRDSLRKNNLLHRHQNIDKTSPIDDIDFFRFDDKTFVRANKIRFEFDFLSIKFSRLELQFFHKFIVIFVYFEHTPSSEY